MPTASPQTTPAAHDIPPEPLTPRIAHHTALRFLMTDKCNLRCTFCHNEFQGDVGARPDRQGWEWGRVEDLVLRIGGSCRPWRAKFSGGEPTLRFDDLLLLSELCRAGGAEELTVFTNLSRVGQAQITHLSRAGVTRLHVNVPSFDPDVYLRRTGQTKVDLNRVLTNAALARAQGLHVQLNVVASLDAGYGSGRIASELLMADSVLRAWDSLTFIGDARDDDRWLATLPDDDFGTPSARGGSQDGRTRSYTRHGRIVAVTTCTDWQSLSNRTGSDDRYVIPPGIELADFQAGRAYKTFATRSV